ncbi:PREDICTED: uncharacterized protein LOC106123202 [Papilio xuthus]|uniref:Uncharacterized protein LOC106123202 n=1 Tax=Papilio xuthus TaxID=66420 RepID=A0AAJ7EF29_PAPXU|nr:PREDICTED: uncharacterized protein LOC106123202 [Papilio xuthus]
MDYDRVIVMDKGRVVESGHPFELLTSAAGRPELPPRRTLLTKSQAPLAIPENFPFEAERPADTDLNETFVLSRDRIRTYSNRYTPLLHASYPTFELARRQLECSRD